MPQDFRSVNSAEVGHFSEQTVIAVRKARAYVNSLLELKEEAGMSTPRFTFKYSLKDKPETVAASLRNIWKLDQIRLITDPKLALEAYIEKLERQGIAIFQLSLTKDNVRGFALVDENIPVIGIKRGNETIYGKIFTLFHELGHIILQVSAISDTLQTTANIVEQWCNAFAAAIIIPEQQLKAHPIVQDYEKRGELIWAKKDLIQIGQGFHAGPLATLRALLNIGRTTQRYYREKHILWNKPPFGRGKTPEGRNMAKETITEKGKTYVALAFRAYDHNQINLKDLSDYLGLRMKYIPQTRQFLSA
jgi:Zn-dependent peptidase ImmA (M78 family)